MPSQSAAQILGRDGELWLESQLPKGWILQRPSVDVGVDGIVVVCDTTKLNGREFRVQVKATQNLDSKAAFAKIRGVKTSTLRYWFLSPIPTLVILYHEPSGLGYYRWHIDYLQHLKASSATLTLDIPLTNVLTKKTWNDIRSTLLRYYVSLAASLHDARSARAILPTISSLSKAARILNSIDHQPIPAAQQSEQQQGILALLECIQHRDALAAVSKLLNELSSQSRSNRRLLQWREAYEATCTVVLPSALRLPPGDTVPLDFELVYAPAELPLERPRLIGAILELIALLAGTE